MKKNQELTQFSKPNNYVWWKTLDGKYHEGRIKEWDNYTAIIIKPDGKEVAVRGK